MSVSEATNCRWGDLATLEYGKALKGYRVGVGDVVVYGTNGPIGQTAAEPLGEGPSVIVGRKGAYRGIHYVGKPFYVIDTAFWLNAKVPFDMRWAYYELLTHDINGMDSGSAIPSTSRDAFYRLPVRVPSLEEQSRIGSALASLDERIAVNAQVIRTIPALIRALVDGALDDASMPQPVSSLASFVNGGAYTKGASGTGRMVIRIADLNSGPGRSTVYSDIEVPDDRTARPGDILMAWSGSLGVHRWSGSDAIVNQHIFKVIPSESPAWLVFDRLDAIMPVFQDIARDKVTTMGHIQRGHLDSTSVIIPSVSNVQALDRNVAPLWDRLLMAEREMHTLVALRDSLIPELISGRMNVRSAVGRIHAASA